MNEETLTRVAMEADMIVCGYAYTEDEDGNIKVLNLNAPHGATVFSPTYEVLETSMDDIEISIAKEHLERNIDFMVA